MTVPSRDRAVSPVVAYVMTLGVTALLIGGLLVASGGFVNDQRYVTAESELQVLGQQVSADIAAADRLNRTDGANTVSVNRTLPNRVLGVQYRISITSDEDGPTDPYLELEAPELDLRVTVGLALAGDEPSLEGSTVHGGKIAVEYDESEGGLVMRNA